MVNHQHSDLMELNSLSLEFAKFVEFDHDIVKIKYFGPDDEITLDTAKRHTDSIYKLRNGKPCHVILNILETRISISNDARDYFAKDPRHSAIRISQAIILDGLAHKIIGNFYKTFHKPNCPVGIFGNEADAIDWILALPE